MADDLLQALHAPAAARAGGLPLRRPWVVVALLGLMFAMSVLDRLILSVVASPVAQSLRLSDSELGLLMGTSFAVLYSVMSLPVANWIDTSNRKRIVIAGVLMWSAMTIASGFARDFDTLFLARSGVAIGEAVLTPAAISLITDLFAKDRRALPMTVYTSVGALMLTGSFVLGGLALALSGRLLAGTGIEPWRLTFVFAGVPGLLLAALFALFVREPLRQGEAAGQMGFGAFLGYLRRHWWFYMPLLAAGGAFSLFTYRVFSWMPTLMVRAHGFKPADAGIVFGGVIMPIQLLSTYLWPRVARAIERRHRHRGAVVSLLLAAVFALPLYVAAPAMADRNLFVGGICLSMVTAAAWSILPLIGFQTFSPPRITGRLAALTLLTMNLVGYGLGPVLTVHLGRLWDGVPGWGFVTTDSLARGLATNGLIAAPVMIACLLVCVRTARRLPEL